MKSERTDEKLTADELNVYISSITDTVAEIPHNTNRQLRNFIVLKNIQKNYEFIDASFTVKS